MSASEPRELNRSEVISELSCIEGGEHGKLQCGCSIDRDSLLATDEALRAALRERTRERDMADRNAALKYSGVLASADAAYDRLLADRDIEKARALQAKVTELEQQLEAAFRQMRGILHGDVILQPTNEARRG